MITVSTNSGDKREFPVTVYDKMVLDTGELLIRFTDQFGGRFNDSGSGADDDGDFYHPIAPTGYYPLGSVGFRGYRNPNDLRTAVIVVQDKGTNPANPPIKPPVGYTHIWNNGVVFLSAIWGVDGCCAGSFWIPQPPPGYDAMGVIQRGYETGVLKGQDMICYVDNFKTIADLEKAYPGLGDEFRNEWTAPQNHFDHLPDRGDL